MLIQLFLMLVFFKSAGASSCLNSACHQDLVIKKNVHGPMKSDGCKICHLKEPGVNYVLINEKKTKHDSFKKESPAEINKTCLMCHDEFVDRINKDKFHHKPIKDKSCIACHDPHQSDHKKLLIEDKNYNLCIKCHEGKSDKNGFAFHRLKEMKQGCLSCHVVHTSNKIGLLDKSSVEETCIQCHGEAAELKKWRNLDKSNVHEPVRKGECLKCHQVHGSHQKFLLDKNYNRSAVSHSNKASASDLCFKCHQTDLNKETLFRNGNKNLHSLHTVNAKNKKDCFACHDIHGSHQGALIRSEFEFLNKKLPLKYQKTVSGGNCTTACHQSMSYNRESEVINEKEK